MSQSHLLLSPNGGQSDVGHETASNHSGHSSTNNNNNTYYHQESQSDSNQQEAGRQSVSASANQQQPTGKKDIKTEYKSKFKPFSEYAYDEVTDSFVKYQHSSAECSISASRSNQDLSGATATNAGANDANAVVAHHHPHHHHHHHHHHHQQHQIAISTHDANVFEPYYDGPSESHTGSGSVAEPWYKEVVKRNEKANEYRFKSEVGHNSPLLNYARSDSPAQSQANNELRLGSPSGNGSLVVGDNNISIEIRSQHSDHQSTTDTQEQQQQQQQQQQHQAAKVQYRFTPSSYKRDNFIAHMANNNNFNLPKEQPEAVACQQPRRATTASSQSRARSQSSRRTPTASAGSANPASSSKLQLSSKSNHTTPTRSTTVSRSNFTMRPTNASTSKSHSKTPQAAPSAPASRYATTTKTPTSANGSGGLAGQNPSKLANKRTPNPVSSRVTPKPVASSRTTTTPLSAPSVRKTAVTSSINIKPTQPMRPKTAAPTRPLAGGRIEPSPSKASASKVARTPLTNTRAAHTLRSAPGSKDKTTTPKTPNTDTAIKSIKTRKAIESETAKAAAAAAIATGAGVALAAGSSAKAPTSDQPNDVIPRQLEDTLTELSPLQPPRRYDQEEQNLIFTTTEAGDMLADELAHAEMAQQAELSASDTSKHEHQHQLEPDQAISRQVHDKEAEKDAPASEEVNKRQSQSGELINGLAGGLVSAEDRFDSSEKDYSLDMGQFVDGQHQEQYQDDEPYSIIPTTTDLMKDNNLQTLESNDPGATFEILAGSPVENREPMLTELIQNISEAQLTDSKNDDDYELLQPDEKSPIHGDDPNLGASEPLKSDAGLDLNQDEQQWQKEHLETDGLDSENVSTQKDAIEVDRLVDSPIAEPIQLVEPVSQSDVATPAVETSSATDIDRYLKLSREQDSRLPIAEDIVKDEISAHELDERDMQKEPLDLGLPQEVPQDNQEEVSSDQVLDLTHNLTGGDDDLHVDAATVGTEYNSEPVRRPSQVGRGDSDLLIHDEAGPAVESVSDFNTTLGNPKSSGDNDGADSLKSTDEEDYGESDSANDRDVNMGQLMRAGGNLSENMIGDIDGMTVDSLSAHGNISKSVPERPQVNLDDIDSDEHLKLSSNLTNSDDELILKPGKLHFDDESKSSYQQQNDNSESSKIVDELRSAEESDLVTDSPGGGTSHDDASSKVPVSVDESDIAADKVSTEQSALQNMEQVNLDTVRAGDVKEERDIQSVDLIAHENFGLISVDDLTNDPVTTSDGLILNPVNLGATIDELAFEQQKQQAGKSDLNLMAQEDRLEGTVEFDDGSSAALEIPTSIENRIEMSTSRSTDDPEMPPANFKFARKISDDSEEELDIDPDEDLIGSAATMSPNASVAEELMRFNAVKDNILELDSNRHTIGDDKSIADLTLSSGDEPKRNNNGLTKEPSRIEPVDVTSHMIDEPIGQLSEQK